MQSNITINQFSPVANAINKWNEFKKFLKFLSLFKISPLKYVGPEKRYYANTENMKNIKVNNAKTFKREGKA